MGYDNVERINASYPAEFGPRAGCSCITVLELRKAALL